MTALNLLKPAADLLCHPLCEPCMGPSRDSKVQQHARAGMVWHAN